MPEIKLIVGLGNPGREYVNTRHNIGFQTADLLAKEWGGGWKKWTGLAEIAPVQDRGIVLAKPQTYMNLSGSAVQALSAYYRVPPQQVLVIVDDFSIPLGTVRLRRSGSAGGHNGLASIIEHLGTGDFPRLRLGIGPVPPKQPTADFVLSRFAAAEGETVDDMVRRAAATVENVLSLGFDRAASKITNPDAGQGLGQEGPAGDKP